MQESSRNLYFNARRTAGLTQERWAELLGISVESVRLYESGANLPSDEIALKMAEATGQQIICYWHLLHKSKVAAELLPEVETKPLPEAVLDLLVKVQDFSRNGMLDLLRIASDGRIDIEERASYNSALDQLKALLRAGLHVEYAEEGRSCNRNRKSC